MLTALLTADPTLGRFDAALLSDQSAMELFAQGFNERTQRHFQGGDGLFADIVHWPGVKSCAGTATDIDFGQLRRFKMAGSIETGYLPRQLQTLRLSQDGFHGTFDVGSLPNSLQLLHIYIYIHIYIRQISRGR